MSDVKLKRLAKLPVWAQDHIEVLERKVKEQREKLLSLTGKPSNVMLESHDPKDPDQYLPQGSRVRFVTSRKMRGDFTVWLKMGLGDEVEGLHVMGGDLFQVEPISGNYVAVRLREK